MASQQQQQRPQEQGRNQQPGDGSEQAREQASGQPGEGSPAAQSGLERGRQGRTQTSGMERRTQRASGMQPWSPGRYSGGPFSLMRRFSEDMDRLFEGFFGSSPFGSGGWPASLAQSTDWPEIEVHQEGTRLVIQADVPGLRREDVNVEVRDHDLWISGERRSQREGSEGGVYRSERTYGSFSRAIPLPEGVNVDSASASFENGVLRIEIEAPEQQQRTGRRIEVREGSPQ
jgi:HSP20 family protein